MSKIRRGLPNSRLRMDTESDDKLSDLPSEVTEKILSNLPIKEAVRTSILSSKWRYKWAVLPDLVFDELNFPGELYNHEKLVKITDHVLILHIGPIDKFKLCHQHLLGTVDIDRWILHLSRNSVKEFSFQLFKKPEYRVPSCLFSCQDLVHLDLSNCLLKLPRTFKGFKSLKKLKLVSVTLTQDDFEYLIACCPVLEGLTMRSWSGFTNLRIGAPNIRFLHVSGAFEDLILQNTLKLVSLYVTLKANGDQRRQISGCSSTLLKLLSYCPHVQHLGISKDFLKYLAVGVLMPLKLPKPCLHLVDLFMHVNFNDVKEILTALYLLRSAPDLQKLNFTVRRKEPIVRVLNSWLDDNHNFQLGNLRTVEAYNISSTKAELDFIKILLLISPKLEIVFVKPASEDCYLELSKGLNKFTRSSAQAKIFFLDP